MTIIDMPTWIRRDADIVVPERRGDVLTRDLEGEVLFEDPRNGLTYHLNPTAFTVWNACDGRTSTRRIAERLVESFDVELDDALDDVEELVTWFVETGLIGEGQPA